MQSFCRARWIVESAFFGIIARVINALHSRPAECGDVRVASGFSHRARSRAPRLLSAVGADPDLDPRGLGRLHRAGVFFDTFHPRAAAYAAKGHIRLEHGPLHANIDRSLVESAVINLALNARDAMENGGRLTIATRRRDDGLAEIAVSDTGRGMDRGTVERATEPFFTTKPLGKGSGLGLSQVVGSTEQMGGRVEIESEEGTGTTVRLLFPMLA